MITSLLALAAAATARQAPLLPTLTVHMDQLGAKVSPSLYGIFFEEINQAGDGGLYAETLRNRGLETTDGPGGLPIGWSSASGASLDRSEGPNAAHPTSIKIDAGGSVANTGFWGVPIKDGEPMRLVLWVKGKGTLTAKVGDALASLKTVQGVWQRIERTLTARMTDPRAKLVLKARGGPVWVGFASLMPVDTWKERRNGLRPDLASTVAAMKPAFVRFPGGCYVEGGDRFTDAFDWKASIGPVEARKGLSHSMWGYPNTFGLGFHEYLQWCEDMGAKPLFVVNAGVDHQQIWPMDDMDHWVRYALDAIEYANGPVTSTWGAERAKNGHPQPFGLKYIEIGNENGGWFHGGNEAYAPRYRMIYDAIKAKHPEITTISTWPTDQPMEMVDEHYYEDPAWFWKNTNRYDAYDRKGPGIYVGEYAVTKGCGNGNLAAALGEAAFMTGMERNSDIVRMSSYAPLLVNVNNRQWNPNAIVFDASRHYGTPSYYVQSMFANNRADRNVRVDFPASTGEAPKPGGAIGLMTWKTKVEFKDVALTAHGKTLYSSAGIGTNGLDAPTGAWSVAPDGTITQSDLEENRIAMLRGATAPEGDYTLSLKARKLSGAEGFLITMDGKGDRHLRWNVGGWSNRETAFQRDGAVVDTSIPGHIDEKRWYDVRIERQGNVTRGYLDGKLVQTIREAGAPNFTAVAGIDAKAHELVLKVVNGSDAAHVMSLALPGIKLLGTGKAIVLTGSDLLAENSFDSPVRIAPIVRTLPKPVSGMTYAFAARSVTVLRLPIR